MNQIKFGLQPATVLFNNLFLFGKRIVANIVKPNIVRNPGYWVFVNEINQCHYVFFVNLAKRDYDEDRFLVGFF